MIPTVHIQKLQASLYELHVCEGSTALTDSSIHHSIAEALKFLGEDAPREMCQYANVYYGDVSIGTKSLDDLASHSEALAHQLVCLCAEVSQQEVASQ